MKRTLLFLAIFLPTMLAFGQTPKVYFPFNGNLTSAVGSYTLTATTGAASYLSTSQAGNGSHSFSFNGATHLTTPFKLDSLATGVTVSFWVKRGSAANLSGILVGQLEVHKPSASVTLYPATFNINLNGGRVYMEWYTSNVSSGALYATDSLSLGWNFVTMVWHKKKSLEANLLLYTNGKLTDSAYVSNFVNKDANKIDLSIGAFTTRKFYAPAGASSGTFFKGELDEVKIFESELTAQQVKNMYDGTASYHKDIEKMQTVFYPNPAKESLTIQSNSEIKMVTVYDINGQQKSEKIYSDKTTACSLDLSHLSPGNYLVRVTGANTSEVKRIEKL